MRPRQRGEGDRRADQARRDRHQAARHGLHGDRRTARGVLQLRQRQRRHQGPPGRAGTSRPSRPIPAQAAAAAKKLIETEKVLGIVGSTSIIECAVNHKYYEEKGFYVIGSGIAPECYGTPNCAAVNMGPRLQLTRRRAVPDPSGRGQDGARSSPTCPAPDYIEGGSWRCRQGGRASRPCSLRGERADPGRELGRAQGHAGGRPERRRGAQLHAARGAQDPPGRGSSRASRTRSRAGPARRRATPTSCPRRSARRWTTSSGSTPS